MNDTRRGILTLVRSAITGEKLPLPDSFNIEDAYPVIKRHKIMPLVYTGAVQCNIDKQQPTMQRLFKIYFHSLFRIEKQIKAVNQICTSFDENHIDYMLLKGCSINSLYPKPELRMMGDADILIRTEQYEKIVPILKGLGFTQKIERDHEITWCSDSLYLELHKRLVTSHYKDYYEYFGDGITRASAVTGTRYELSHEDEFIYLFTHFTKHYQGGGIGCRHAIDLWVYQRSFPDLDKNYIKKELETLRLLEFYENICKLLRVWFEQEESDEKTEFITDFIFESGSWGKFENHALSSALTTVKNSGSWRFTKIRMGINMLFPPMENMQLHFPILKKTPYLFPLFWPVRWIKILIFHRERIQPRISKVPLASAEKIETYQQALNYVGLDYNFR